MKSNLIARVIALLIAFTPLAVFAQEGKPMPQSSTAMVAPAHRIVFQLATNDSMAHKQLLKQLGNIVNVAPGTKLEVVCHGPGLDLLIADKSISPDKIKTLRESGVTFQACEYSMKDRKVEKSQMLADASYVPYALIHIATRQEQGWSYIKSGF